MSRVRNGKQYETSRTVFLLRVQKRHDISESLRQPRVLLLQKVLADIHMGGSAGDLRTSIRTAAEILVPAC